MDSIKTLVFEMRSLCSLGETKMDPFRKRNRIGPGPYGRRTAKRKANRFRCKCAAKGRGTLCKCKSRAHNKNVFISASYKSAYNSVYREWAKKRRKTKVKKKRISFQDKAKIG